METGGGLPRPPARLAVPTNRPWTPPMRPPPPAD